MAEIRPQELAESVVERRARCDRIGRGMSGSAGGDAVFCMKSDPPAVFPKQGQDNAGFLNRQEIKAF